MTLSVRNEADTIEDFIRYHLAVGIDGILVSDRGSSDGTLAILDRLSSQLPLVVLEHSLEAGAGRSAEERLGRFAADRLAAQWVIDGSISEFWLTDGSDLLQGGEPIAEDVGEILVNTTTFLSRNPAEGWSTVRESTSDSSSARRMRRVAGNGGTSLHLSPDRAMVGLVPAPSHEVLVQRAITSGMESDLGLVGELGASATWASLFSSWLEGALDIDAAQHAVDPVEVGAGMADGSMVVDHRIVEVLAAADGHLRDLEPIALAPPAIETSSDGFILVAGMHRSGTSAVARVINLLGADIGDAAALMEAKPDNPSGFWENQAFAAIDDDVIALLGGRWDLIPPRAIDWSFDPRFDDLRNRAQEVAREFSDAPKRVVKDPRLSITLPFWRGVIPVAGVVLPIRHPMEVAGSLWARDDMDQEMAGELWCAYVESTLAADPGCAIVDYDRLVADPVGTASVLADALGLPPPSDSTAEAIRSLSRPIASAS